MAKPVRTKSLEGIGDLTLLATVRPGFVDALEAVTFETRLKLTLEALFRMRTTAREYYRIRPFVDTAERIQSLLDFRITLLPGEPRRVLLTVTFDRPFDPYMRLIWWPLGGLLDLVFCHCKDYKLALENSFDDYMQWVREHLVDTDFFYAADELSVSDHRYLSALERVQRDFSGDCSPAVVGTTVRNVAKVAEEVRATFPKDTSDIAVEALVSLYRLTDYFPADLTGDGRLLHRAMRALLDGWTPAALPPPAKMQLRNEIAWWDQDSERPFTPEKERLTLDRDQVQPGILRPYTRPKDTSHGCLLLLRVRDDADPAKVRAWIAARAGEIGWKEGEAAGPLVNLCFTHEGLARVGVPDAALKLLPPEFRDGMAERATALGDVRAAHPRNWTPPRRYADPSTSKADTPSVSLTQVDVVLHLRVADAYAGYDLIGDASHPLRAEVERLEATASAAGIELLAIEPMRSATGKGDGRDHFGFVDGLSQPELRASGAVTPGPRDEIAAGELLWGYRNDREDGPQPQSSCWDNGSFLVVRTMRQNVDGLDALLDRIDLQLPGGNREDVLAKMMGRTRNGDPLAVQGAGGLNDFDYQKDLLGAACPFQAHIRRANPRTGEHGRLPPRIVRRGLSYGPAAGLASAEERGVVFLAFNASIAEQFEVIQRWINGGNSTAVASCQGDPFMAVARDDAVRTFQFSHNGTVTRIDLQEPLVTLKWGLYLFAPSHAGLLAIANGEVASNLESSAEKHRAEHAETIIDELLALAVRGGKALRTAAERWKALLEDPEFRDPARQGIAHDIYAIIGAQHGGVLRIVYPDGTGTQEVVLVTTGAHATTVLRGNPFSMKEQRRRMSLSLGDIYLGLDAGLAYQSQSAEMNKRLLAIGEEEAFDLARGKAELWLDAYFKALGTASVKVDLRLGFLPGVLAEVCRYWFGVPDCPPLATGNDPCGIEAGGSDWQPIASGRRPRCPGDFTAPSRYCFNPDPTARIVKLGQDNANALIGALTRRLQDYEAKGLEPPGSITETVAPYYKPASELARTIIGVMTGFLPPAEGSMRAILSDWLKTDALWRIQSDLLMATGPDYARAKASLDAPMRRAMQKRPVPDMLFRTATQDTDIGGVRVGAGERVIVAVAGITGADAATGSHDVFPIFGGDRSNAENQAVHACPAYAAAMGTMLGTLSALLDAGRIEKLPATLLIRLTR